jgi:hypothetical protein
MIITLSQVKSLLNISGTSKDTLISALIPEAEAKYLQIRNYPFAKFYGDTISGDKTITGIAIYPSSIKDLSRSEYKSTASFINRLDYINSTNIDNYVTEIDEIYNTIEIDTAASATESIVFTVYPQGAKMTASKLIQYLMQSNSMNGLQSESVGSYSWSKATTGNPYGVPDDIFKSIKRYVTA